MVLSASAEAHGQSYPELATDILTVSLDDSCPECFVHVSKTLDPLIKDVIIHLLRQ